MEILIMLFARLLKEGIELAFHRMFKGTLFGWKMNFYPKTSVNAPTKHRVRPNFILIVSKKS